MQLLDFWLVALKALNTQYLWTLFYHQDFFMTTRHKIYSNSTKQSNRKDMPPASDQKNWNSKGVTRWKTRECLYALVWKDRWEVYVLTNMDPPPVEENSCYDSTALWNLTLWLVYLANWVCWHFWSCGQQLFNVSLYFKVYHTISFSTFGPNGTQQLDSLIFV
jgi:hypothetical protein